MAFAIQGFCDRDPNVTACVCAVRGGSAHADIGPEIDPGLEKSCNALRKNGINQKAEKLR